MPTLLAVDLFCMSRRASVARRTGRILPSPVPVRLSARAFAVCQAVAARPLRALTTLVPFKALILPGAEGRSPFLPGFGAGGQHLAR
ncbi:MAG: hypothetical protein J5998_03815, partial [Clostridia bacterium]|nr:hypothetical protein [Clostridia bacterium]